MEFRVKNGKKNKKNASRFAACAAAVMMIGAGAIAGDSWRAAGTAYAAAAQETSAGADAAVVQAQQVSVEKMQQSLPYRMN